MRGRERVILAGTVAALLVGCQSAPPPIDVRAIGKVQAEIKRQVGVYLRAAESMPVYAKVGDSYKDIRGDNDLFWCGTGNVDYDISSVTADLTTSLATEAKFSATIAPTAVVAPTATFSFGRATSNAQSLSYRLWPVALKWQDELAVIGRPTEAEIDQAPIARVLLDLRQAQIEGATKIDYSTGLPRPPQPCFSNYDPAKPDGGAINSYQIGLVITNSAKIELGVGTTPFKAGGSYGTASTSGHSITVTFVQRGVDLLHALKVYVDKKCEYPNRFSNSCTDAIDAFERLRIRGDKDAAYKKLAPIGSSPEIQTPPRLRDAIDTVGSKMGTLGTHPQKPLTE